MSQPDGTRSVLQLLEEERDNGYSNMTDNEIKTLMDYKQYFALKSEEMRVLQEESDKKTEIYRETLEKERLANQQLMEYLIGKPRESIDTVFETVESEVE